MRRRGASLATAQGGHAFLEEGKPQLPHFGCTQPLGQSDILCPKHQTEVFKIDLFTNQKHASLKFHGKVGLEEVRELPASPGDNALTETDSKVSARSLTFSCSITLRTFSGLEHTAHSSPAGRRHTLINKSAHWEGSRISGSRVLEFSKNPKRSMAQTLPCRLSLNLPRSLSCARQICWPCWPPSSDGSLIFPVHDLRKGSRYGKRSGEGF